jgi:hypothetical protein
MKRTALLVAVLAYFEIISATQLSLAFSSSKATTCFKFPPLERNMLSSVSVLRSKIFFDARSQKPKSMIEMKGSFFSSDPLTKILFSVMAQASLPNLAQAAIFLSSEDDVQNNSQAFFVAKCVLSLVIVGIFISLYIPPSEITLESIERPATREKIDSVLDDLRSRKKI